jgi:hypothetical protein
MAAVVLTILIAFLGGGGAWLLIGARFSLDVEDRQRNDVLNLIAYIAAMLPIAFGFVFFLLGGR